VIYGWTFASPTGAVILGKRELAPSRLSRVRLSTRNLSQARLLKD
jgi:hypothetical protein